MKGTSNGASNGIGFGGLLQLAFIVLKLVGVISWSWAWVLSPIWIGLILFMILFLLVVFVFK